MRTLFMSCLALALVLGGIRAAPAGAAIAINEILADPAGDWDHDGQIDAKLDEWVEVINQGTEPVNLSDYWLKDESATAPRFNFSGVIDPGETAVFFGSDAVSWQHANGISTQGFSLNNGGDTLYLMQGPAGGPWQTIQTVTYPDHVADDDRSYGADPDGAGWLLFDGLFPYNGSMDPPGTGCSPTPAEPNQCHTMVPDKQTSFGAVKATYM